MLGSMLSTLKESAGWMPTTIYKMFKYIWYFDYNKRYYKYYRGQASYEFQIERRGLVNGVPEGVQSQKRLHPSIDAKTFLSNCNSAIASAISYLGTNQITDLNPDNVEFLKITQNGFIESKPISYYKYLLIGDFFLDFYFDDKIKVFYGGVLNVQKNIEIVSSNKFELKTSQKPKCLEFFKK